MKKIAFFVIGNSIIGTGHVFRVRILFNQLKALGYDCAIFHRTEDQLAKKIFNAADIQTHEQNFEPAHVARLNYDLFILDILDTRADLVKALKEKSKVVTFEDLGEGSLVADMVINAMYPEKEIYPHHYYGHRYFEMRDEFLDKDYTVKKAVSQVLVTFGGTDPCNLTYKVLDCIYDYCLEKNININVVAGLGYTRKDTLTSFARVGFHQQVNNISEHMVAADIAFSSGGRTVYELACIGVPSVILCQNERETMHFFASKENGFQQMGLGDDVEKQELLKVFDHMVTSYSTRQYMNELMSSHDLKNGTKRVVQLIEKLLRS